MNLSHNLKKTCEMNIGDIYSVEIPSSNGHEQAGIRPAIIVQSQRFKDSLPTVLIVPLTS